MVHDPTHVFFKLPRPVDRPIEFIDPILPILYVHSVSAFPFGANFGFRYKYRVASTCTLDAHDPKGENMGLVARFRAKILIRCLAYLRNVMHVNIFCDLCMDQIRGQWFHCVYCPRDLCGHCEEVDEHDRNHFSMVAKAPVCVRLNLFDPQRILNMRLQVDMNKFYRFTGMSAEDASGPPIMKYPVYYS